MRNVRPDSEHVGIEAAEPRTHRRPGVFRSIPELLRRLRDDLVGLLRDEVALAKAEMSEKASRVVRNVVFLAIGGAIAYAGVIFLLLGGMFGIVVGLLKGGVPIEHALWIAAVIVGGVVAIVGYIFIQKGVSTLRRETPVPEKTVRSLQEDRRWLKEKIT
jgi:uncharacterized membrane protein YqjE